MKIKKSEALTKNDKLYDGRRRSNAGSSSRKAECSGLSAAMTMKRTAKRNDEVP